MSRIGKQPITIPAKVKVNVAGTNVKVEGPKGTLELVYPRWSIRAEPHVAVVDANVDRRGTREVAEKYLAFLFTPLFRVAPPLTHPLLRGLCISAVVVGVMTFVVMPRYTRLVRRWLYAETE